METELLRNVFFFLSLWQRWRTEAMSHIGTAGGCKWNGQCSALEEKNPVMQVEA